MVNNMPIHPDSVDLVRLLEKAPVGFLSFDSAWKVTFVNTNFFDFGVTEPSDIDSLAGISLPESSLVKKLGIEKEIRNLCNGVSFEKELSSVRAADGSTISIVVKGTGLSDSDSFTGGILILEDIRIAAGQQSLNILSEKLISRLAKESNDIFLIADTSMKVRFSYANEFFSQYVGGDAAGQDLQDLLEKNLGIDIKESLYELATASKPAILELTLFPDEREVTLQIKLVPFTDQSAGLQLVLVFINDISAGRSEEILNRNELAELKQYQFITSAVTDAVIATDIDGNINFWNKSAEKLFN
ncbi:MAG: PAS domain-containing protein, partial [Syntrophothermus sp.]